MFPFQIKWYLFVYVINPRWQEGNRININNNSQPRNLEEAHPCILQRSLLIVCLDLKKKKCSIWLMKDITFTLLIFINAFTDTVNTELGLGYISVYKMNSNTCTFTLMGRTKVQLYLQNLEPFLWHNYRCKKIIMNSFQQIFADKVSYTLAVLRLLLTFSQLFREFHCE